MEFYCAPGWKVGMIGSMYLAGVITGLVLSIKHSNSFGRRTILMGATHINAIAYTLIFFFSKQIEVIYGVLFLMGVTASLRNTIGFVYGMELIPKTNQVAISTIQKMIEQAPAIIGVIYFRFITKEWIYLQLVGVTLSITAAALIWILPESPRYLVSVHQYEKARDAFNYIARYNKTGTTITEKFEQEAVLDTNSDHGPLSDA